jgi:hypothetical protein
MLVTLSGMAILVRALQPLNAEFPILVTLFGIVTPVSTVLVLNALFPMLVTGNPFVVAGIITSPPDPVYPVIVIAPLLVTKVYWARTATGEATTKSERIMQAIPKWRLWRWHLIAAGGGLNTPIFLLHLRRP